MADRVDKPSTSDPQEKSRKLTRRDMIKGVIAAGAVSSTGYLFRSAFHQTSASSPGSVERLIMLNVNGQQRAVDVMKQETLAMTLRYKLGLTGTKLGCDRAECGCCTVLIDDVPHYSCSVLTHTHARQENRDHRRAGRRRWHASSRAAGRRGGARVSVRLLHVRLHHGDSWIPEGESESDARGAGARHFRQPLPMPGLRQDSHCAHARRRTFAGSEPCLTQRTSHRPKANAPKADAANHPLVTAKTPPARQVEAGRAELHHAGPGGQGDRQSRNMPRIIAPMACSSPSCCSALTRTPNVLHIDAS